MAITTELVGKLGGGGGGFIWQPEGGVTYDLGPNFGGRIAVSYGFSTTRSVSVNGQTVSSNAKNGYWIIPDEKNIPNPRYITIGGSGTESNKTGMYICVTPVENGLSAPPKT